MNEFMINNNCNYKQIDYLDDLINYALAKLKIKNTAFSIILTDNEELNFLNKTYRGVDKPTDVISFAFNDKGLLPGPINILGDIYISIPKMQEQALTYGHSEKRELSFLVVHGLLHLLGYDHVDPDGEKEMFALQEAILNEKETRY